MYKFILAALLLISMASADSYKLHVDAQGGQGTVTILGSDSTEIKYQHDGSVVPTNVPWVLDSVYIHAVDAAGNTGPSAYIFVKITPVNDHAPVIKSDTITVQEGGSVTFTPTVTDADN